jgi:hypothetical protein
MTDRELLELAAKAARIDYVPGESWDEDAGWNPLEDDGDALRLAVKLNLCVVHTGIGVSVSEAGCHSSIEHSHPDPYAATRRAIVRAAAEIGRNMK